MTSLSPMKSLTLSLKTAGTWPSAACRPSPAMPRDPDCRSTRVIRGTCWASFPQWTAGGHVSWRSKGCCPKVRGSKQGTEWGGDNLTPLHSHKGTESPCWPWSPGPAPPCGWLSCEYVSPRQSSGEQDRAADSWLEHLCVPRRRSRRGTSHSVPTWSYGDLLPSSPYRGGN